MCHQFMAHPLFSFLRSFFIGFHGWIGGILAYRITHGFSRIFGLWPMDGARNIPLLFLSRRFRRWRRFFFVEVFCPTDFTDDADFSSWKFFVPQISQMTQIFLRGSFLSHRFHRWRRFFFVEVFYPTDFTDYTDFSSWKFFCPTDFTDFTDYADFSSWDIFHSQGVSVTTE